MKLLTENLGRIITVIASIALVISVVALSAAPVSDFFGDVVDKETGYTQDLMDSFGEPFNKPSGSGSGGGSGGTENYKKVVMSGDVVAYDFAEGTPLTIESADSGTVTHCGTNLLDFNDLKNGEWVADTDSKYMFSAYSYVEVDVPKNTYITIHSPHDGIIPKVGLAVACVKDDGSKSTRWLYHWQTESSNQDSVSLMTSSSGKIAFLTAPSYIQSTLDFIEGNIWMTLNENDPYEEYKGKTTTGQSIISDYSYGEGIVFGSSKLVVTGYKKRGENVKLVAAGDSITHGTVNYFPNYSRNEIPNYGYLASEHYGFQYENLGYSGMSIADIDGENGSALSFTSGKYLEVPDDTDILTLWFGYNDAAYGPNYLRDLYCLEQYGQSYSTCTEAQKAEADAAKNWKEEFIGRDSTDIKTWCGAWRFIFEYFTETKPIEKIGVVIPYMPVYSGHYEALRETLKELCEEYDISYIDAADPEVIPSFGFDFESTSEENAALREIYVPDGIHPNAEGHKKISEGYIPWLEEL